MMEGRRPVPGAGSYFNASPNPRVVARRHIYRRPGKHPFMIVLVKTRKCQKEERRLVLGLN